MKTRHVIVLNSLSNTIASFVSEVVFLSKSGKKPKTLSMDALVVGNGSSHPELSFELDWVDDENGDDSPDDEVAIEGISAQNLLDYLGMSES